MDSLTRAGRQRIPAEERRTRLLEVAQRAFVSGGYAGTSTLEIARQAEVSEALVLKHFGTKEALFRGAVVEPLMELLDGVRADNVALSEDPAASAADDFGRLRSTLVQWAAVLREQGPLFFALLSEMRSFPDIGTRMGRMLESEVADLAESARQLVEGSDDYRPFDVRYLTLVSLAAATIAGAATDDPEGAIDEFVEVLFLGVLSSKGRTRLLRSKRTKP